MNLLRPEPAPAPRRRATDLPKSSGSPAGRPSAHGNGGRPVFTFELARSLQLHRKLAIWFALGGLTLAIVFLLVVHPAYTAQSIIFIQPAPPRVIDTQGRPARWPNDPHEYESFIQHQVSTVTRHDVLAGAIHSLKGDEWLRKTESEAEAVERLGRALAVERVGAGYQIAINATAATPASAAHVANAVAGSFLESAHREEKAGDTERLTMLRDERERIQNELTADRTEQEALNKQLGKLQRSNDLATDILRLQQRFAVVDEQFRNQTIENAAPGSAHLAAAAEPPLHTARSGRIRIALTLVFAGLLFGGLAAVLKHKLDPRIYIPADVEQVLGFPPMGLLPDFGEVSEGVAEEHLLRLAAAIDHARLQSNLKSCIFTGTGAGAGVTTVVTRTRAMLGAIGRSTFLMDASGPQHSFSGAGSPAVEMRETSGPLAALRGSRSTALLRRMDEEAREQCLVLTDSAPLLLSAETEYLSRFVDAVIVVIESGRTTRAQLREVATSLQRLNVAAVGFILNRIGLEKATPGFRASVQAMEEHLQPRVQPSGRRNEALRTAVADRPGQSSMETACGPHRGAVQEAAQEPAVARSSPAAAEPPPAAAPVQPPAAVDPEQPGAPEQTQRLRPPAPRVEVTTYVASVADADRHEVPLEKERIMARAPRVPLDESPLELVPDADRPWWLVGEPKQPGPPNPVAPLRPVEVPKASATAVQARPAEIPQPMANGAQARPVKAPGPLPPATPLRPVKVPSPAASAAGGPLLSRRELGPEAPAPRVWEEFSRTDVVAEPRSATEEVLEREMAGNSNDLASRLSGLRNLFLVLGKKSLDEATEPREQVAEAARESEPKPAPPAFSASFPPVLEAAPSRSGASGAAPATVTATPEILPPKPAAPEPEKELARSTSRPSRGDQWDDGDEFQILPSRRGQYRRKG